MPGPMDGIRIVELSVALTGPLAVAMRVDQGADAIKIEPPGLGDQGRYIGVSSGGVSALFQICNRGKRSIAERQPDIVYTSISGFGPDGPYAHRRAYDSVQPHLDQSASARQKAIAFSDGHAVVTPITDAQFHGLASTFGVDPSNPLVATIDLRFANREAMSAVLRDVHAAAARLTLAEGVERLEEADVPYGVVLALEQVVDDAQVRHNQLTVEHQHPQMGRVRQIRPPARFSRTPADLRVSSSPAIGEHTDDILREHGWGNRLEELRADGVIE